MLKDKNTWSKAIQIASAYIGTVVGAGFASGQEIIRFFTIYGPASFIAIIISTFLFIVMGIKIMNISRAYRASSFKELIELIFGKKIAVIVNVLLTLALMVTTTAMLAGASALFEEQLHISYHLGGFFTGLLAIVVVMLGVRGLLSVNVVVVPVLILFNICLFIYTVMTGDRPLDAIRYMPVTWLSLTGVALMYVAFNLILSIGVLAAIGCTIDDRKAIIRGGITGGAILGLLIASSNFCLWVHSPEIFELEIPILYIVLKMGSGYHMLYSVVVWGEIFTTLIASVFSLAELGEKISMNKTAFSFFIVAIGLFSSRIGFSNIVGGLYPLIGFTGLFFILLLILPPGSRERKFSSVSLNGQAMWHTIFKKKNHEPRE